MPIRGAKPKPNAVTRTPRAHEWTEFPDVPYEGERPRLPRSRRVSWVGEDGPQHSELKLHPLTLKWWDAVSRMPHCVAWSAADWMFAVESALVADAVFCGDLTRAAELRMRESKMWCTADARAAARVRYVQDSPVAVDDAVVTDLDRFRRR